MAGLFQKLFGLRDKAPQLTGKRSFNAGQLGRTTSNWSTNLESSNRELRYTIRNLRTRSRYLANNNEYARKYIDLCVQNIVGADGVGMDCEGLNGQGKPDEGNNEIIEAAFEEWGQRGICTMDGLLSWRGLQQLVVESVARDGEILLRPIVGKSAGNKFGFAIQVLEIDHLDEMYTRDADATGSVVMGVEVNTYGRVIAYHILQNHPGDYGFQGLGNRERVPASDLLHIFVPHRPHQRRGYPWLAASMQALYHVGEYTESEAVAARIAAAKMGFYKPTEAASGMDFDDKDGEGMPIQEVEPGMFEKLPFGWDFQAVDWQHPSGQFDAFVKGQLRGAASGGGVPYHSLTGDLSGANYSSLREGRLEATDQWSLRQRWFIDWVCQPIFERWLEMAVTTGTVKIPTRKIPDYARPCWRPRGWKWVDPMKEAEAAKLRLALGLTTRTAILAEQGEEFEDVIEQIAEENAAMRALGLNPDVPIGGAGTAGGQNDGAQGNQDGKAVPNGDGESGKPEG